MSPPREDQVKRARGWKQRRDSPRAQRAEHTRARLIEAARDLFSKRGFHEVGLRDVAALAGVSRGALAHHFADKDALFLSVFEAIENELMSGSGASHYPLDDPWAAFRVATQRYLGACASRIDVRQVTLVDAPVVFGWKRWRELEESYSLGTMILTMEAAMAAGRIRQRPVEPLAHLILGSVMEAALLIANSDDPVRRLEEVGQALDDLLCAFA